MAEIVRFDSLPFWRGVQSMPGVTESYPFGLSLDPRGFVRQDTTEEQRHRISRIYEQPDYVFITPPPGSSEWANAIGAAKVDAMLTACGSFDGMRVLEIGAGNLTIALEIVRRFKIQRYIAVDPTLPETGEAGIETRRSFFPSPSLSGLYFDIVVGLSCLEHVEDPVAFLGQARECLAPHGRIFLTFPDIGAMLRRGDLNALVHEHMSYFDAAGFRSAAACAGLDIVSLSSSNGLFSATLRAAETRPVERPPTFRDEAMAIRDAYRWVIETLGTAIRHDLKKGRRIAFHGACPGLANFLWLTGLSGDESMIVADGDRSKWGKYLPACPVAIRMPDDTEYLQADRIYIAATSFSAEISRSLAAKGVRPDCIGLLTALGQP